MRSWSARESSRWTSGNLTSSSLLRDWGLRNCWQPRELRPCLRFTWAAAAHLSSIRSGAWGSSRGGMEETHTFSTPDSADEEHACLSFAGAKARSAKGTVRRPVPNRVEAALPYRQCQAGSPGLARTCMGGLAGMLPAVRVGGNAPIPTPPLLRLDATSRKSKRPLMCEARILLGPGTESGHICSSDATVIEVGGHFSKVEAPTIVRGSHSAWTWHREWPHLFLWQTCPPSPIKNRRTFSPSSRPCQRASRLSTGAEVRVRRKRRSAQLQQWRR